MCVSRPFPEKGNRREIADNEREKRSRKILPTHRVGLFTIP